MANESHPQVLTARVVPTFLLPAVLVMLFFCPPIGLISLLYSIRVSSHAAKGNWAAAETASRHARQWVIGAFVAGSGLYCLLMVIIVLRSAS